MGCIGRLTTEYRERMHALCELYARPHDPQQPVVCLDEKSKQLLGSSRAGVPERPGQITKEDCGYVRRGTRNIFMAVEPLGGHRETSVTARRTKVDFVQFVCGLLDGAYRHVTKLHLVLDNLNTHLARSFHEVLGEQAAAVLQRMELHHTPKHASWLNLAELELGIMERPCTGRRLATAGLLMAELQAWQQQRHNAKACLRWSFTHQDADRKLGRHYVT